LEKWKRGVKVAFALGPKIGLVGPPHTPYIEKGGRNYTTIEERLYF
jgi:hypothetical protein